jgi:hypothetical protein
LLEGILLLMRQTAKWEDFRLELDKYYPKFNETLQLPFEEGERVYRLPLSEGM